MICEYFDRCAFIQHKIGTVPVNGGAIVQRYRKSDKYGCARFCLFRIVAPSQVPVHIWPSDETEAMEVIEDTLKINE
jgi:hypothetical protein